MRQSSGNRSARSPRGRRRAFTLVDVLVTMAVVAILIGLMAPGLGKVREAARRVVCSSNLRQVGLGLALYADGNRDLLPSSIFLNNRQYNENEIEPEPQNMMMLRLSQKVGRWSNTSWDGLGWLYKSGMLPSSEVFYCPSHHGEHPFDAYAEKWKSPGDPILGNYHFRGVGPNGERRLSFIEPSRAALAADGLRTLADFNHKVGLNVLRADLSLFWLPDSDGLISSYLEDAATNGYETLEFDALWEHFDNPGDGSTLRDK